MATPLNPQEIFLLERYTSVDYFAGMRDAWHTMIDTAEKALQAFEHRLPASYRSRPLHDQPDVVWGERVLVNFRYTLDNLDLGLIELTHSDFEALGYAGNVSSDFAGFTRDHSSEWMNEPTVAAAIPNASETFWDQLTEAIKRALNIEATYYASWSSGALSTHYRDERGPLSPPAEWPSYRLDASTRVFTGSAVPSTGIYLPDVSDSAAAFLMHGKQAPEARIGYNPRSGHCTSRAPTWWTLVKRVSDGGGGIPGATDPLAAGVRLRCEAGVPCPREGWWFTPAKAASRQHFRQGEVMPDFKSDYGLTIWQWDEAQS